VLGRVTFRNFKSLKSVTLELSPLTVLVGPNGSGKSSVLAGLHMLSKAGQDAAHGFRGANDPRRLASPGRPTTLSLAMYTPGGKSWTLTIRVPGAEDTGPAHELISQLEGDIPPELRSAIYLHLDAAALHRTSTTDAEEPRMAADGEGLASTLAWLAGAKPDTLAAIAADLARIVPGVRRILVHRERLHDRLMEKVDIDGQPIWRPVTRTRLGDRFSIAFDDGSEVPADLLSEGTVLALGLLTKLHEPGRPRIVLLDDLDRGLHLAAQAQLIAVLRGLMRLDPELQIVCSTHSTHLLNLFDPAEVRVLALDAARSTHARALTDHPEFDRWKFGAQTGELWAALGDAWVAAP
jgi:predicted ATPase